jgi:hypothetical protein
MSSELTRDAVLSMAEQHGLERAADGMPGRFERCSDPALAEAICELELHGEIDAAAGETEAPTGFFTLLGRWIVRTDSQGFVTLQECDSEQEARDVFISARAEYDHWATVADGGEL